MSRGPRLNPFIGWALASGTAYNLLIGFRAVSYWITTHWPRLVGEPITEPHEGIWVQDGKWEAIAGVTVGDLAFIYESRTGRKIVHNNTAGGRYTVSHQIGREGVVGLVEITGTPNQPDDTHRQDYTDGTSAWWRFYAPTRSLNSAGFISRIELTGILGYSQNYVFRGFGDQNSGLKKISEGSFNQILQPFLASAQHFEQQRRVQGTGPRFGGTGEGPEHRELKERIAADPATVLGEPGLRLWKTEWLLATGDRVDVVLKDRFDPFVAVEVEVDCDANESAGPLQCMKYRAMISYFFDRPVEETRCMLAAHSIHSDVENRCINHSIEVTRVPRKQIAVGAT